MLFLLRTGFSEASTTDDTDATDLRKLGSGWIAMSSSRFSNAGIAPTARSTPEGLIFAEDASSKVPVSAGVSKSI
jgi:hypothetical protein